MLVIASAQKRDQLLPSRVLGLAVPSRSRARHGASGAAGRVRRLGRGGRRSPGKSRFLALGSMRPVSFLTVMPRREIAVTLQRAGNVLVTYDDLRLRGESKIYEMRNKCAERRNKRSEPSKRMCGVLNLLSRGRETHVRK